MKDRVYLFGGSGYIGSRVLKLLHEKGYHTTAVIRKTSDTAHIREYVSEFIECTFEDPASISEVFNKKTGQGVRAVFAAGIVDYSLGYEESVSSNVSIVLNLIGAMETLSGKGRLDRLVFIGSAASRGFLRTMPDSSSHITENKNYHVKGLSVYSDVKHEAGEAVRKAMREKGLRAVIIEPGSLVGPGNGSKGTTNTRLIKKILAGFPVLSGGMSYTSIHRAAEGIVASLERGRTGETYLLGGENMKMTDFAGLVLSVKKRYFPLIKDPFVPVKRIPAGAASILGSLGIIINRQQALLGSSFHYLNYGKAAGELGYEHTMEDLVQAVRETIEEMS